MMNRLGEQCIAGGLGDRQIEVPVGKQNVNDGVVIVRRPAGFADLSQAVEAGGVHAALCRQFRGGRFQQVAHAISVPHRAQRQGRDESTALGRFLDEAFLHEPRQGGADRRLAESVSRRQ